MLLNVSNIAYFNLKVIIMGEYASKGLANGVGIPALVLGYLGFLGSGGLGGLGGLFGNNNAMASMAGNAAVATLAQKDAEIGQLKAEKYTNDEIAKTYIALHSEIGKVNDKLNDYALANERRFGNIEGQVSALAQATNSAIAGINNTLSGITKTIVAKEAICPEYMNRYNSWTAPTTPAA